MPKLDRVSDSGALGDGITNVKAGRIFDLIATEPTATLQLFRKQFNSPDTPPPSAKSGKSSAAVRSPT